MVCWPLTGRKQQRSKQHTETDIDLRDLRRTSRRMSVMSSTPEAIPGILLKQSTTSPKMQKHNDAVDSIAASVASFYARKTPFRVYHGSTNSTRNIQLDPDKVINTTSLSNIISLDLRNRTILVEPNVSMSALVRYTMEHNLLPLIVPEFPAITIGGAFSGTAAESSSFLHGYFDRSVNWFEIVLPDGTITRAGKEKRSDLFWGAAGAMGTLGLLTMFEIRLVEAGKFVEIEFLEVHSFESAVEEMDRIVKREKDRKSSVLDDKPDRSKCNEAAKKEDCAKRPQQHEIGSDHAEEEEDDRPVDFLDGIMYSSNMGAIVVGRMVDKSSSPNLPIVHFSRSKDDWYYLHVHTAIAHLRNTTCSTCPYAPSLPPQLSSHYTSHPPQRALVPISDYLFRYDRGAFWMSHYGWPAWAFTTRFGRFLFDRWHHTAVAYKALHMTRRYQNFIIQDLAVPRRNAVEFQKWTEDKLHIFPLWLCPIDSDTQAPLHKEMVRSEKLSLKSEVSGTAAVKAAIPWSPDYFLNIGLWGIATAEHFPDAPPNADPSYYSTWKSDNRAIEAKVKAVGGRKWLYAQNFYTEDEFWGKACDRGSFDGGNEQDVGVYDKQVYDNLREKYANGASLLDGNVAGGVEEVAGKARGEVYLPSLWDKVKRTDDGYVAGMGMLRAMILAGLGREHLMKRK